MKIRKMLQLVFIGCLASGLFISCWPFSSSDKENDSKKKNELNKKDTQKALKKLTVKGYTTEKFNPGILTKNKLDAFLISNPKAKADTNGTAVLNKEIEESISDALALSAEISEKNEIYTMLFEGPAPTPKGGSTVIEDASGQPMTSTKIEYIFEKGVKASREKTDKEEEEKKAEKADEKAEEENKKVTFLFKIKEKKLNGTAEAATGDNKVLTLKVEDLDGDGKKIIVTELIKDNKELNPAASAFIQYFLNPVARLLTDEHFTKQTTNKDNDFKDDQTSLTTICTRYGITSTQITLQQK